MCSFGVPHGRRGTFLCSHAKLAWSNWRENGQDKKGGGGKTDKGFVGVEAKGE